MKKIAVFIGDISGEFQVDVLEAVRGEAKARGVKVFVYANAADYGANVVCSQGERISLTCPI